VIRLLVLALAVRLLVFGLLPRRPILENAPFWETLNIASSLANHRSFSSPFAVSSGPTAWMPPLYPALLAFGFEVAGTRSHAAAVIMWVIQALFSALTCFPLFFLAQRAFGRSVAIRACLGWALFPYAILMPLRLIWDTMLFALLLSWLVYFELAVAAKERSQSGGRSWDTVGGAALTKTALVSAMPFCLLFPLPSTGLRRVWRSSLVARAYAFAVAAPWLIRDRLVLGTFVPIRSNFGEEFWLGNHQGSTGRVAPGMTPTESGRELERYRTMGEMEYVAHRQREALRVVTGNPGAYIRFIGYRVLYGWATEQEDARLFMVYAALGLGSLPALSG